MRYVLTRTSSGKWRVWTGREYAEPETAMRHIAQTIEDRKYGHCPFCGTNLGPGSFAGHPCHPNVMEWRTERKERENSMANVVICDPCGNITAGAAAGGAEYRPNPEADWKTYTLCAECSERVYDILHPQGPRTTPVLRGFDPSARPHPVTDPAETTRAALTAEYGESA